MKDSPRFILDVHLGKLARRLRMLGFDSLYKNDYEDQEIVNIAFREKRIVLTRDRGIINKVIIRKDALVRGYLVRSHKPKNQLLEIIEEFDLRTKINPLSLCMECNYPIERIDKELLHEKLHEKTLLFYNEFYQCTKCKRIYWEGSHYKRMNNYIKNLMRSN